MSKFRKKPVVIEAVQWDGTDEARSAIAFLDDQGDPKREARISRHPEGYLTIWTLEGAHRADMGDWIIRGVRGELYPCKPDIFEATYEAVLEAPDEH